MQLALHGFGKGWTMTKSKGTTTPLLSTAEYRKRILNNAKFATLFLSFSMSVGISGYHYIGRLSWLDAFYNAAMILTGMGPVDKMEDAAAKIFAGLYAIYSGVAFLTFVAVLFAPIFHRFLHRYHLETEEVEEG
jgi:hypothetical protein